RRARGNEPERREVERGRQVGEAQGVARAGQLEVAPLAHQARLPGVEGERGTVHGRRARARTEGGEHAEGERREGGGDAQHGTASWVEVEGAEYGQPTPAAEELFRLPICRGPHHPLPSPVPESSQCPIRPRGDSVKP